MLAWSESVPPLPSLRHATTKPPTPAGATTALSCDEVTYVLTWNWLPAGAPAASNRCA
jgi:hypothetical protein